MLEEDCNSGADISGCKRINEDSVLAEAEEDARE